MKNLFWLVGLFAAAVALALLMGQNDATVTLFWSPYRIDLSFNLVLTGVLLAFVVVYAALRSVALLRSLPEQAQRWRWQQRERAVHAAFADALAHQLAGRFVRARSSAETAIEQIHGTDPNARSMRRGEQLQVLSNLLAAEASQSLQDREGRDRHLAQALGSARLTASAAAREGVMLRAIRWAVEDRDVAGATHWLSQLPQGTARRTLALRLKLRVARLANDPQMALETARLLAKHKAFSAPASRSILRGLALAALQGSHDVEQVQAVWRGLDGNDRQDPELVLAVVARLQRVSQDEDAERTTLLAREWLLLVWDAWGTLSDDLRQKLVLALEGGLQGIDTSWLARIENLQRQWPADPLLQYLAAQTFFHQKLWGKAQLLFQQSAHTLNVNTLRIRAWCRLAQLAQERGEDESALHAWKQAALLGQNMGKQGD